MKQNEQENTTNHWLYRELKNILSTSEIIKKRVKEAEKQINGKRLTVNGKRDLIADYLIKKKSETMAAVGALTGAVGVIPIIGQVGAVVATVTAELITITHQEVELCLEIACNYGHGIDPDKRILEILAIIGNKGEIKNQMGLKKATAKRVVDRVFGRYARIGMLKALRRTALRIELKTGLRAFTKIIPILGMGLGAALNYRIGKTTGFIAKEYYKK